MSTIGNQRFAALLRAHRVAAGLSQEELAERARLSRRTISNLERGTTAAPYGETVALLAEALDLNENDRAELERSVHRSRTPSPSSIDAGSGAHGAGTGQGAPLLATKLAIPPARPALIPRPYLLERLRRGLQGPLTLLSAPPGSGKTTLVSAWRATPEGQRVPLAWVSLDEGDNDAGRFWRYVLTALDHAAPGVGNAALAALQSADPAPVEAALTAAVNALAALPEDITLILDDYHLIEAEPIHRMLAALLERLPPCLHLLLATRADPPLPLARLRAQGAVTELRAADLRFTGEEAAEFLTGVMGLGLSPAEVSALEARTEGWIAGLQLAGLSLQGRSAEDTAAFIADFTGSHRYIVDYLLDEVLLRQPEEVQRFLLHTCVLDQLCAPLCAAVLEGEDSSPEHIIACQQLLESLERDNVFLIALDDERRWYRYHHLFADALCQRRSTQTSVPDGATLHRRASAWFEQQGLVGEAIRHALAGGSYDAAADLIPRSLRPIFSRGTIQGLSDWYNALPEAVTAARPDLSLGYAWILLDFRDLPGAEKYVRHAETALATMPQSYPAGDRQNLRTVSEAYRALIAVMRGDAEHAIPQVSAALDTLSRSESSSQSGVYTTPNAAAAIGGVALGLAHVSQGAAQEAATAFGRVTALDLPIQGALALLVAGVGKATAHRLLGDLDRAQAAYEEIMRWDAEHAHAVLLSGSLYTGVADVLRERNELDKALEHALQGMRLEQEQGVALPGRLRWIEWHVCILLVLARIAQARGEPDGALARVREAQAQLTGVRPTSFADILAAFEAQLHLAKGDVHAAVRWLRGTEARQPPLRFGPFPLIFVYAAEHLEIAPIQVLIAQGRAAGDPAPINRALSLLDRLQERAARSGLVWLRAKALVLEALARRALDDRSAAFSALDRALVLAEPRRLMRIFLDEGAPMAELLRERRVGGAGSEHAAALLAAVAGHRGEGRRVIARPVITSLHDRCPMERLTERELEVLRLLAAGRSTPEIARTLYVEVNTVRTHVKHLYGKLGVHSRDQAVWRAQELGLLENHPRASPSG